MIQFGNNFKKLKPITGPAARTNTTSNSLGGSNERSTGNHPLSNHLLSSDNTSRSNIRTDVEVDTGFDLNDAECSNNFLVGIGRLYL